MEDRTTVLSACGETPSGVSCARVGGATEEDWLIYDLVIQSIRPNKDGEYFSEFIGAFARALRHCCKAGLMIPVGPYSVDDEDRVFAAVPRSERGTGPVPHDPATCWWCQHGLTLKSCVLPGVADSEEEWQAKQAAMQSGMAR